MWSGADAVVLEISAAEAIALAFGDARLDGEIATVATVDEGLACTVLETAGLDKGLELVKAGRQLDVPRLGENRRTCRWQRLHPNVVGGVVSGANVEGGEGRAFINRTAFRICHTFEVPASCVTPVTGTYEN